MFYLPVDVTLACEGHAVKAHRIILCACSGYFGHILRTINPAQHPVLLLSDVRPNDLTALMDFIYFGQVKSCYILRLIPQYFYYRLTSLRILFNPS